MSNSVSHRFFLQHTQKNNGSTGQLFQSLCAMMALKKPHQVGRCKRKLYMSWKIMLRYICNDKIVYFARINSCNLVVITWA